MTRAILSESGLSVQNWPYCFLQVSKVYNRLPHSSLPNNTTPYQELTCHKPTHQQLQPILCRVFALKRDPERLGPGAKALEQAVAGIRLGCARYRPGYYVQISDNRVIETSDVRFALLEFPMTSNKPQP
eukprot:6173976-Pleurochrysis_carterae.AAC.1